MESYFLWGRAYLAYTSTLLFFTEGSRGRNSNSRILKAGDDAEALAGTAYWLASRDFLNLISCFLN